jgi:acyl-CoA thioester hydrolase
MRIIVPEQKKLMFEMTLAIRWGDMDAMGHVNNASYFRFMETVRIDWFTHMNVQPDPTGAGPVIINAFCNFHHQLEYPGIVLAKQYVASLGTSSFDTYTTLERTDAPGKIYSSGGATVVWIDFPAQKSVPLPAHMRELLS